MDDPRLSLLRAQVEALVPAGELAHDLHHLDRVRHWAVRLAPEAGADAVLCAASAYVHDLALVPKDGPDRALGGERSAALAPTVLRAAGFNEAEIAPIVAAVASSSWSKGHPPANAIGRVLQDADRLDAIGAVGLLRTAACGQWMSRPQRPGRFYDPSDPLADGGRALDDRTQVVDHLFAKLLRLADGMHLPSSRIEARRRHAFLVAFLEELRAEIATPPTNG